MTLDNYPLSEGLEYTLQLLETEYYAFELFGAGMVSVCIKCYSIYTDATCTCAEPVWWPIHHVIGRLKGVLGQDGYDV